MLKNKKGIVWETTGLKFVNKAKIYSQLK